MKQIILEGPDLAGKSTVSELLTEITGKRIHHFGGPPKSSTELFNRIKNAPEDVIYDRFPCISEQVYGVLRGRSCIDSDTANEILRRLDPIILYCNPGISFLKSKMEFLKPKSWKDEKHVKSVLENYDLIYDRYLDLMSELRDLGIQVVEINFTTITEEKLRRILK